MKIELEHVLPADIERRSFAIISQELGPRTYGGPYEEGILKRQTRSIQTEGHFGDIKENENFRRFHYRSKEKVYKEFMLYAIGRNIMKYHRFLHHEIEKYEGKKEQKTA